MRIVRLLVVSVIPLVNRRLDDWVPVEYLKLGEADASQVAEKKKQKEQKVM